MKPPSREAQRLPAWVWHLLSLCVFLALWFVCADVFKLYPPYQMPPLLGNGIVREWIDGPGFYQAALQSLRRIAIGYTAAVALGAVLGIILSLSSVIRNIVGGWLTLIQSIPSIAFVPLALIWFGLNERAVLFVVILEGMIPIALTISSSIANVPPSLRTAGRTLGAKNLSLYTHVLLPASLPNLTTALRTAWAFSWRALIGAELLTPNMGLGQLLETGRNVSNTALVLAALFAVGGFGLCMDLVLRRWERNIRNQYGLEED